MTRASDPMAFLPLTPAVFHILLAVMDRERHGYAIIKEIERRTEGKVVLSTGTLYAAIKRLREDGLIEETEGRDPELDDERRRYFRVTASGQEVVRAETMRLRELVGIAEQQQLRARPAGDGRRGSS